MLPTLIGSALIALVLVVSIWMSENDLTPTNEATMILGLVSAVGIICIAAGAASIGWKTLR